MAHILERSMACCSMRPDLGSLSDGGVARKLAGRGRRLFISVSLNIIGSRPETRFGRGAVG
jgi:hypothetical protein